MSTRERILDAAAELLRGRGIASATTKEIALAGGVSEPTLYKYFGDKEQLLLAVLRERLPGPAGTGVRPGTGSVAGNLTELAAAALAFYRESIPMLGALLADPRRMAAHRAAMREHDAGPEKAVTAFAAYLRAERDLGRIAAAADPDSVASLLVGACFHEAFLRYYAQDAADDSALRAVAHGLVTAVLAPLV